MDPLSRQRVALQRSIRDDPLCRSLAGSTTCGSGVRVFAIGLLIASSGCLLVDATQTAAKPENRDERHIRIAEKLNDLHSVEAIDAKLSELLSGEGGQQNAAALIEGWGRYDCWYDLAVVMLLWDYWPSYYGEFDLDAKPLIPIVKARLKDQPDLNRQVFWYVQWKFGPRDLSDICGRLAVVSFCGRSVAGEEFSRLLYVAGLSDEPNKVLLADWDKLYLHLHISELQFLRNRPFWRYDNELGHYVLDGNAIEANRYLDPEEQRTTHRPTPLPNWDHPVVPQPPTT